jgi:hypothetical protein
MNLFNNDIPINALYSKLEKYYSNNSLYDTEKQLGNFLGEWVEDIHGIRTCVNRSVEFYVSQLIPGDLSNVKVNASNAVSNAISQIWNWSNFESQKQLAVRQLALYGNLFWKAASDGNKVWFEIISPKNVTELEEDKRGYIQKIRIDYTDLDENNNCVYVTEYWEKEGDYFAVWQNSFYVEKLEQMGNPVNSGFLSELGIDFIPIVHIKFKDIGKTLGIGCTNHALDKIDEANREASRLVQLLYKWNKPLIAISTKDNTTAKPIEPLKKENLALKDNAVMYLKGDSQVNSLVPNLDYEAALKILQDMMNELENDLPELKYYSMKDGNLSGKAIKMILQSSISKAIEARGNLIRGLIRINQICLTLGKVWGIFSSIGSYENGDFNHTISLPELFPLSIDEISQTLLNLVNSGMSLKSAMRLTNFSEDEIEQAWKEKSEADALKAEQNLNAFNSL